MEQIAAGKGSAPKPFMTAKSGRGQGRRGLEFEPGRCRGSARKKQGDRIASPAGDSAQAVARPRSRQDAGFRRAAALHAGRSPAGGEGWCHEIKFDGYRVQLRVEDGKATLKTRKGLDWTDKFQAIAKTGTRSSPMR